METIRWSVAQIFSKRAHRIWREAEDLGHQTFTPTYARRWISDGKPSSREAVLFPGYLIFKTAPEGWGDVASLEGVIRVLNCDGIALPVSHAEHYRLVVDDAMGVHNEIAPEVVESIVRRRRRKPRPSKRARMAMRALANAS